jgi:hypothetical protein
MHPFLQALEYVRPGSNVPPQGRAARFSLSAFAFLAALAMTAAWGVAAGSHDGTIAFSNALKVPILLVVSSLAALPVVLVLFRMLAPHGDTSDLVVGHAMGTFGGSLVLVLLAPLVALYQCSSAWAGPVVAFVSALIGIAVAIFCFTRTVAKLRPTREERRGVLLPMIMLFVLQASALAQLASMTSPVFPHRTHFGQGVDALSSDATSEHP